MGEGYAPLTKLQNNQSVLNQIKGIAIENYLSRGGKACVMIVFDRLKDAKEFEAWLTKRRKGNAE